MTDEHATRIAHALENIASALETIAFQLNDDGAIGEAIGRIVEVFEAVAPEGERNSYRYLRTLDIGRD
jgi:thymidine phosphorylase